MATYISVTPSFNVPGLAVVRKTVSSVGSHITKQLWGERTKWRWLLLWQESYLSPYGMSYMTGQIMSTSNLIVKSPPTTDDHDIPSMIRLLSLWWVRPRLQINFMSWKAMEVSMSKTRRGKYIDNRICHKGKCKGDMRFNLRGKGKIPCFSYLCEGNHFRFIEERYEVFGKF